MRIRPRTTVALAIATAVVLVLPGTPASAADGSRFDRTAQLARAASARVPAPLAETEATVQATLTHGAKGSISVAVDSVKLSLRVPNSSHSLVDSGDIVIASGAAYDIAIQARPGGVRAMAVINDAAAPDAMEYSLDGASLSIWAGAWWASRRTMP